MKQNEENKSSGIGRGKSYKKERFVKMILEMILAGFRDDDIMQAVTNPTNAKGEPNKNFIDACEHTIKNYIKEAYAQILDAFRLNEPAEFQKELAKHFSQINDIYKRSYNLQDFKTCLNVLRDKAALLGLSNLNINVSNNIVVELPSEMTDGQ